MIKFEERQFIEKCLSIDKNIFESLSENASQVDNITCFNRQISGVLQPKDKDQVIQIMKIANEYKVSIYPISTGYNWGFGSSAPVKSGGFILKLSRMNKIEKYDEHFGSVAIEPGVTQKQLSDFLINQKSSYFLDITGSSQDTSIIGNAMDRGISYYSHRCESIINMEIILPCGELIKTGFLNWNDNKISGLYKYAPGPYWDGIFFQSNFGIIVSATYQLRPQMEQYYSFAIEFNQDKIEPILEAFFRLKKKLPLENLIHIANRERFQLNLKPLRALKPQNFIDHQLCQLIPILLGKSDWIAFGSISGPRMLNKIYRKLINDELKPIGRVQWREPKNLLKIAKIASFLKLNAFSGFIKGIHAISQINSGLPTNLTIVPFLKTNENDVKVNAQAIDKNGLGFIYCVAMAPLTGIDGNKMLQIINTINRQWSVNSEVTLNIIGKNILESVVSLTFDRKNSKQIKIAHQYMKFLQQCFIDNGYPPYRLSIEIMNLIPISDVQKRIHKSFKKIFDPNNLLASGRYNLD